MVTEGGNKGELVAKTEGGELVFYGKDNKPGEKDELHSLHLLVTIAFWNGKGEKPQVNPQHPERLLHRQDERK